MRQAKVTTNGRLTIPALLRKKHGLHHRMKVKFETDDNGIKIIPLVTPEEVKNNIGFLGTKGKLIELLLEEKKREIR